MWHSALLLATVLPTLTLSHAVVSVGTERSQRSYRSQCNMDIFTAYPDSAACPCGPIIICAGCPTGCCCPTSSQSAYPPPAPPPPYPPYGAAGAIKFPSATALFTTLLLFHIV